VYSLTWLPIPTHAKAFRDLNWAWVERLFKIEESDIKQLEQPEETIIKPGGEIFFLQSGKDLVGTVAMVHEHGDYELAKMSVGDAYQGRGYSHVLMHSTTMWGQKHKIDGVTILSSQRLVNAIALYKKHGYETVRLGSHPSYARCDIIMRLNLKTQ
jgi:putative acetyltransferase